MNIIKDINSRYDAASDSLIIEMGARLKKGEGRCVKCGAQLHAGKNKKYCSHPECQAERLAVYHANKKVEIKEKLNTIIEPNPQLEGKIIKAQCAAQGHKGRCPHTFRYKYELTRTHYPRFCDLHTNAYRRHLLSNGKIGYED